MLKGQEGQCDIIFIGYELYNEGFYHKDKQRKEFNYKRLSVYFCSVLLVFVTQLYFIHHIVIENSDNIRTITNVDHIENSGLDVYKMYTYTKDSKQIQSVLHNYKEQVDNDFELKYTDKTCDALSSGKTEESVIGLKKQLKRVGQMSGAMILALIFVIMIVTEGTYD